MARTRALLTERDRELLMNEDQEGRRYQTVSVIRGRIQDELTTDVEILREHHPDLAEELRDVVCRQFPDDQETDTDPGE
ncbi:hypothetical protein DMJ13_27350 [halophilic archaeon]|nr:hypothetical protein DMJ13_27350 [halophilic archaeon]